MKKNLTKGYLSPFAGEARKLWKIMRLTVFLFFMTLLHVSASVYSQKTKLNLNLENASLQQVFKAIQEQSEFDFFYNNEQIPAETRVTTQYTNTSVEEILNKVLDGTGLKYYVLDKDIVISSKEISMSVGSQQQKSVSGKVIDASGTTLPGVSVVVKGTTTGVITDNFGTYSLSNVPANATLQFSFVGMKGQEIAVGSKTTINVTLAEEIVGIEEVVAIGYGTMKKSDLTGSIATVSGDIISKRQSTQISQALQGTMPGVLVTRDNSAPGSGATIRIRGVTTIGDSNPLVIVDGVPVNSINDVNSNDVESISVLKDAASASIYGSRAASGVILITTKRANTGEVHLNYEYKFGLEAPTRLPEYVDATRYLEMVNEMRWNDVGNKGTEYPGYSQDYIKNYKTLNAQNPDKYPITNWIDLCIKKYAPRQSHIISLSAGSQNLKTNASITYDKIDGLYSSKTYERITSRINNDITINKYISASVDFYFKRSINSDPSVPTPIYQIYLTAPIFGAVLSNGNIAEGKMGFNIYGKIKDGGFNKYWDNVVGGKAAIYLTLAKGLKLSGIISPNFDFYQSKNFNISVPYYSSDSPSKSVGLLEWGSTTSLAEARNNNYQVTSQLYTNYEKSYRDHYFNLTAGYENYHAFYENLTALSDHYQLNSFPYLDLGNMNYLSSGGNAYENAYRSYFGRIMYNFKNKYSFQGNIRYDGSSRFDKTYRWGVFPSMSAGWIISEESFMKNIKELSLLKLRANWGTLGNERIGNYPYQSSISFFNNSLFYKGNKIVAAQSAAPVQYPVKDITWESTESYDVGIDANFFNNKLRFSGDFYKKTTKGMLLALEIPDFIGFGNPSQNAGKMFTKGWELEMNWNNNIGKLNYGVSLNLSDFKSVMGDLGGTQFLGDQIITKGSEYNEWYGYLSDGLFQSQNELNNSAVPNSLTRVGDIKYKDISGPNGVPDGKISPEYDRVALGGSLPRYMYGATFQINYKNFDFAIVTQGIGKQNSRLEKFMIQPMMSAWGNAPEIVDGHYWSTYNTAEQNLAAKYPRLSYALEQEVQTMSDFWLFNGAYLRIKDVTLGYTLPKYLIKKARLDNLRVYLNISDLLSIDNYPKGWDPEVGVKSYPITTSYILGVSIKF